MSEVKPTHYRIHLEPDLKNFTFSGRTEILIEAGAPVTEIDLNILDMAVWTCRVRREGDFVDCPFCMDSGKEILKISLPGEMLGNIHLRVDFVGKINNRMAGFYRSRYVSRGKERHVAVTQFEERDARRAFPCFDHPIKKATFEVEMVIDKDLAAISNGPIKEERPLENGKKLVMFQETPKMSTYLLFFGVGEFEFIEDPEGDVLIRAATMPGLTEYAGLGLEFGRKSLRFSEDYYGVPYPIPKLDLIAIADFAAGAMENWGAITFRENLLLHFPESTSKGGEARICEVVAHEIAHQWFGNLVTPSDWKYLWLNESFATYFAYGVVNHYYPDWDMWDQFLHGQTDTALNRDALVETFPIEIPGGEHVVINVSTAPIIYNKGGSILRQVEAYVGEERFRDGLRHYLKKHAFACASSHHLWEALEEVSDKPVKRLMQSWIGQPGFPVIEAKREGDQIVLSQRRFSFLGRSSDQVWLVPLAIGVFFKGGETKTIHALLENGSMTFSAGSDVMAYKVNMGRRGFYRVRYHDEENLKILGEMVANGALPPEDRWGLQNDLYAMVRGGEASMDAYLNFLSHYVNERAYLPLVSIASNLFHSYLVLEGPKREKVASMARSLLEGVLEDMGCEPKLDEKLTTSLLREHVLWHSVLYDLKEVAQFALDRFRKMMKGEKVHPDLRRSIMQAGAWLGGENAFEWFRGTLDSSESEHERIDVLTALGSFRDRGIMEEVLRYVLESVPDRNKFIPLSYLAVNPFALPNLWEWYVAHLKELEGLHPMHYERIIAAIVPLGGMGKEEQVKNFLEDYARKNEKFKDVIRLSLERLEIHSRMRNLP
jgi:tricorn protease interacting factor F2/3